MNATEDTDDSLSGLLSTPASLVTEQWGANEFLVYPAEQHHRVQRELFDAGYLAEKNMVFGQATGRGEAYFFQLDADQFILRHYYRGGAIAKISRDTYLWRGLENTRAYRELSATLTMHAAGLPVPKPFAARVVRKGAGYSADIISSFIPESKTLMQLLAEGALDEKSWRSIGELVAQFHRAGVNHADLNVANILYGKGQKLFLIDFDRVRLEKKLKGGWRADNLDRLQRSLNKSLSLGIIAHFTPQCWEYLLDGYSAY